jgi:hypothetical protein
MATKTKKKEKVDPLVLSMPENRTNESLLLLDPDNTASSLKSLKEIVSALNFLHEQIKKGEVSVSNRHNILSITRSELRYLEKYLGAEADLKQENDLKQNLLRQANMEVARLREELGKGVTVEAIGSKIYQLDRTIYEWWQELGFAYSKATFQSHSRGASFGVEFSVRVERHIGSHEEKPITAKAKIDATREALGQQLEIVYDGDEPHVVDNPNNRAWLTNKFQERFPTAKVWKWESRCVYRMDIFEICQVEVRIDITDIDKK